MEPLFKTIEENNSNSEGDQVVALRNDFSKYVEQIDVLLGQCNNTFLCNRIFVPLSVVFPPLLQSKDLLREKKILFQKHLQKHKS